MIPRTPKWKEPSSTAPEPQVGAARSVTRRGLIEAGAGAAAAAMVSAQRWRKRAITCRRRYRNGSSNPAKRH